MPTNIYNVPAALWNSMTVTEQATFNHRFAGGIQNADVRYHPTFNSHIAFNKKATTAVRDGSPALAWMSGMTYSVGDVVSYEGQTYVVNTDHIGSSTPGSDGWLNTEVYFTMSQAYAPYAESMFASVITVPYAPGKEFALKDLVSYQDPTAYTPWADGVTITAGDLISNAGVLYICIETHTSAATFSAAEATHFVVNTATDDYVCTTAHTATTGAPVLANFTAVTYVNWRPFLAIAPWTIVKYLGQFYKCTTPHTSTIAFDMSKFTTSEYVEWEPSTTYSQGDLISYDNKDYIVATLGGFTSGPTFDATDLSEQVAELTLADIKNIKTYFEALELQQPVPGVVTGVVGSEINTGVVVAKKFFDVMYNDLIKQTVHTVKNHTQFNI